jgi:hypothetical protein
MTLVLVDTSAWIDFFRDAASPYGLVTDRLLEDGLVCTCNLVIAELVPAARTRKEYDKLADFLGALPTQSDPPDMWNRVKESGFILRRKGVNGVGIPDLIIAAVSQYYQIPVFSKDRHFAALREHLGIVLFDPS